MTALPVREMVLYKHGVGFFVRGGVVNTQNLALTFKQDEINDVLKSLAVFDQSGGQVLGIHYDTPMDVDARLNETPYRLGHSQSMKDLIRDLRGRTAALLFNVSVNNAELVVGRVIGIDEPSDDEHEGTPRVVMTDSSGQIRIFRFDMLRSIDLRDDGAKHDLNYFLDTAMSADVRRSVHIRLSEGEHDLAVYYVAPSPTWRVSYRVVAETDSAEANQGKALIQAWGLFDNRLDEDLQDVRVTLVAGQPISFIYDLYASRIPHRPTVQDAARVAPGPLEFEGSYQAEPDGDFLSEVGLAREEERARGITMAKRMSAPAPGYAAAKPAPIPQLDRSAAAASVTTAAQGQDRGEFFQYQVTTPVSVKRGESALVPIIGAEIGYQRELLYNASKLPTHPVAALRFINTSGLTFERGPVTVVENGEYRGEAIVPFTKENGEVYLPYAVELGVRITEFAENTRETVSLSIAQAMIRYDEYNIYTVLYVVENSSNKPASVLIEAAVIHGYQLFNTDTPLVDTATERRWRVDVPARGKTEFKASYRQLTYRNQEIRHLEYQVLSNFLQNKWLDRALFDKLNDLLDKYNSVAKANTERNTLDKEREKVYKQQEQLRANLNTLTQAQEQTLRQRMLNQLEQTQNRLDDIESRSQELTQMIEDTEKQIKRMVGAL
jgi:hypothetical protein